MRPLVLTTALLLGCGVSHPLPPTPLSGVASVALGDGRVLRVGHKPPMPADAIAKESLFPMIAGLEGNPTVATYRLARAKGPRVLRVELLWDSTVAAYRATFADDATLQDAIAWYEPLIGPADSTNQWRAIWRQGKWSFVVAKGPPDSDFPIAEAWLYYPHPSGTASAYGPMGGMLGWEQCLAIGSRDCYVN